MVGSWLELAWCHLTTREKWFSLVMAGPVREAKSTTLVHKATIKEALWTNSTELMVFPADIDWSGHLGNRDLLDSAIHGFEARMSSVKTISAFADSQDRKSGAKEISSQIKYHNNLVPKGLPWLDLIPNDVKPPINFNPEMVLSLQDAMQEALTENWIYLVHYTGLGELSCT